MKAGKDLSKSDPEIAHKREYLLLKSVALRCSVRIADKVSCIRKDRIREIFDRQLFELSGVDLQKCSPFLSVSAQKSAVKIILSALARGTGADLKLS